MNRVGSPSGIESVGNLKWGSHFCHVSPTREGVLNTLVPFFTAGLCSKMRPTSSPRTSCKK